MKRTGIVLRRVADEPMWIVHLERISIGCMVMGAIVQDYHWILCGLAGTVVVASAYLYLAATRKGWSRGPDKIARKFPMLLLLCLGGCSRGPQVDMFQAYEAKWACYTNTNWFEGRRRVAICDSKQECNDICGHLPKE